MKADKGLIIVRIWEGLGNQLFQYAYARALKEKGLDVRLDLNKSYDDVFEKYRNHTTRTNGIQNLKITLPEIDVGAYGKYEYLKRVNAIDKVIFWCAEHHLWKYEFLEEDMQCYQKRTASVHGNYYVKGWFQSEKYFKDIREILLRELYPKQKIKISSELREILQKKQTVSLHIRRGDFVKIHYALNTAYYYAAMERIKKFYDTPMFLIFSDEPKWVKENFKMDNQCVFVSEMGEYMDYEELMIMSRCHSNIISNSTFSWWGAWLNQNPKKVVIAPKKWGKFQTGIIPDEWITLK